MTRRPLPFRSAATWLAALLPMALHCGAAARDAGAGGARDAGTDTGSARPKDSGPDAHDALQDSRAATTKDASTGAAGDTTGPVAVPSNTFLASIGVCAHVTQGVDAPGPTATALAYAGVRNVRDDGSASTVPAWLTIHEGSGVLFDVLTDDDVSSTLAYAEALAAAGALLAVEGPNEPNNFPVTYGGQTSSYTGSFLPVANLQSALYAAVKADAKLAGIPVFHASEAGGSEPDDVGLQFLTIPPDAGTTLPSGTLYADYANTHNYVCGNDSVLSDNVCWNAADPTLNGSWDGMYVEYGITWHGGFTGYPIQTLPTVPRVTTETGWVTMGTGAITEEQQGRLFLNLYLAAFKQGVSYTFIYMMRDDPVQGYWGLFDTTYAPKPSGLYIHNLTTILADTATFAPGRLDYSITGEPATVHDLLLEKGDGTFELAVWNEQPLTGSQMVIVSLGHTRQKVSVYDPTMGTTPVQVLSGVDNVTLTLTDHPQVIEL